MVTEVLVEYQLEKVELLSLIPSTNIKVDFPVSPRRNGDPFPMTCFWINTPIYTHASIWLVNFEGW